MKGENKNVPNKMAAIIPGMLFSGLSTVSKGNSTALCTTSPNQENIVVSASETAVPPRPLKMSKVVLERILSTPHCTSS